jgi:hypothetical protein
MQRYLRASDGGLFFSFLFVSFIVFILRFDFAVFFRSVYPFSLGVSIGAFISDCTI